MLSVKGLEPTVAGGGSLAYDYILTNRSSATCILSGYPKLQALRQDKGVVAGFEFRQLSGAVAAPQASLSEMIRLHPGEHAWFQVIGSDVTGLEDRSMCGKVKRLRVFLPGDARAIPSEIGFITCTGAQVSFLYKGLP